jgi:hypothetical protein
MTTKVKLGTYTLNGRTGFATVSAREVKGEMQAYSFSNETQAKAHAKKVGGYVNTFRGRVFYVVVNYSKVEDWNRPCEIEDGNGGHVSFGRMA